MGRGLALRRRRAALGSITALVLAAASFAACLDFGDLSGADGGASATADGGDASPDAPASADATSNLDGASANDGEAGSVIAPFVSCAALSPQPALCADFDEGSLLGNAFTSAEGNVSLDSTSAVSGTHSLLAISLPDGGETDVLRGEFDASFPTSQHLSMQFFPGGPSTSPPSSAEIASWYIGNGSGGGCSITLQWGADLNFVSIYVPGVEVSTFNVGAPPANQWSKIDLTIATSGAFVTASISVNDQDGGASIISCGPLHDPPTNLGIGLSNPGSKGDLRYDNVIFEGN